MRAIGSIGGCWWVPAKDAVVRAGLIEQLVFEQRWNGGEGAHHVSICGNAFQRESHV